jgi:hypothetical protein
VCCSVTNNSTWVRIGYRIYLLWRFITATGYSYWLLPQQLQHVATSFRAGEYAEDIRLNHFLNTARYIRMCVALCLSATLLCVRLFSGTSLLLATFVINDLYFRTKLIHSTISWPPWFIPWLDSWEGSERCGLRVKPNPLRKMAEELQDISKLKVRIYTLSRFIILSEYKNNMW